MSEPIEPRKDGRGMIVAVIPAYNEEKTIAKVVVKTKKFVDRVIVCDDGSKDDTGPIAEALGVRVIRHEKNMGKGETLRSLMREAKGLNPAVVVTLDGDDQHDPAEIPKVVAPVLEGRADVVIGARAMKFPDMPMDRVLGNRVLDSVTSAGVGTQVRDTQSGFRAYSPKAIASIEFKNSGMATESQTLIDAGRANLSIVEVPVSTRYWGIVRKRRRLNHFSEVVDYLLSRTVVDSPILYLGLPGLLAVIAGIVVGFDALQIFLQTHQIALGTALVAITFFLIGALLVSTSLILKFISATLQR